MELYSEEIRIFGLTTEMFVVYTSILNDRAGFCQHEDSNTECPEIWGAATEKWRQHYVE